LRISAGAVSRPTRPKAGSLGRRRSNTGSTGCVRPLAMSQTVKQSSEGLVREEEQVDDSTDGRTVTGRQTARFPGQSVPLPRGCAGGQRPCRWSWRESRAGIILIQLRIRSSIGPRRIDLSDGCKGIIQIDGAHALSPSMWRLRAPSRFHIVAMRTARAFARRSPGGKAHKVDGLRTSQCRRATSNRVACSSFAQKSCELTIL
jgi:hypothetical protein